MKNSIAKSKSSTFLPLLQSATRQTFDGKSDLIPNERIDPIEALPSMIYKLSIDENTKRNIASKSIQGTTTQKEITEHVHNLKRMAPSLYDIDKMSLEELQASLCRITENPQQPFSFLANISNEFVDNDQLSIQARKPTEIDIRLAAVAERIESSKILLAEAKSCVENMYLVYRAKQDNVHRSLKTDNVYEDKTMVKEQPF